MKLEVTDTIGTYTVNTKNKPVELEQAETIYLNIFDNGERENAARYKIALSVTTENGEHIDWYCSVLNKFEPGLFFRSVPEAAKDQPFYRQVHKLINDLKNSGMTFEKKPSAGFFKLPRTKGMKIEQRPIIINAIATMFIEEGELPVVAVRFMDFTWNGEVPKTAKSHKGPKWSICLKSNTSGMTAQKDIDVDDYF